MNSITALHLPQNQINTAMIVGTLMIQQSLSVGLNTERKLSESPATSQSLITDRDFERVRENHLLQSLARQIISKAEVRHCSLLD
jgi:hypothetical protein